MSSENVEEKEVLLADEIAEKFPLFLGIGPFFQEMLWFEQLVDLLGEVENLELFIPEVRLFDGTEIEVNLFYQLLASQFSAQTFVIELPNENKLFELETLSQHEYANEKVSKFVSSSHEQIDLLSINDELTLLLAKQYGSFLDEELQPDYVIYQKLFVQSVAEYLDSKKTSQVFLLPIEMMQETLVFLQSRERTVHTLKDFLEVFTKEKE